MTLPKFKEPKNVEEAMDRLRAGLKDYREQSRRRAEAMMDAFKEGVLSALDDADRDFEAIIIIVSTLGDDLSTTLDKINCAADEANQTEH